MRHLLQDLRYAWRMLAKSPGFTIVAVLTLALGIGATTIMFTVFSGVLLRPLPFPDANKLVALHGHTATWNAKLYGEQNVAYRDFLDLKRQSKSLDLTGGVHDSGTVSEPGEPAYVEYLEISPDFFSLFRVRLAQGREFLPDEDRPGAGPVMILGYSFWQTHFSGDPKVIGTSVVLDGNRYTVVGIAPTDFQLNGDEPDLYTVLGQDTAPYLKNRQAHPTTVFGRLRPGATLAKAQAEADLVGGILAKEYADTNGGRTFIVQQLRPDVGDARTTLWLLLGAVGIVLLIACANVASLLLARAVSREHELAVRATLGASRWRLARQCLTESALLGLAGGALGVFCATLGVGPFVAFWPGSLPRAREVQLDWRVLIFTVAVSLLSSIVFGLAPAMRAPVRKLEQVLRAGSRTIAGGSRRLHSVFVVSEISLAVILLVAAGMLGRTLLHLASLDPGVDVHNVLVTRMALSPATLADPAKIPAAWQDVLERARHVPGVKAVAAVDTFPMRQGYNALGYSPTANVPPQNKLPMALATCVTPDYFKVMGIRLRRGRVFTDEDREGGELVIVIDDVLAKDAFGGADPLGKRLWMPDAGYGPFTVVGVVGHVRHWGLADDDQSDVRAQFYYPFAQLPAKFLRRWSELMSIAVKTNVPPLGVVESLRQELKGVAGDQVLYEVRTMEQLAGDSIALQRFLSLLFAIFAGLALLLACVGIYGVLAYLIGQRVPEIGVRMALGATPAHILQMVLRQSFEMIFVGVGVGFIAALAAARLLVHLVAGMVPADALTFVLVFALLGATALSASFVPAWRASRVDPAITLREE